MSPPHLAGHHAGQLPPPTAVLGLDPLPPFVAPPGQPTGHVTVVPGPHLDGHQAWSPRSPVVALLLCAWAVMTPQAKQAAAAERRRTFLIEAIMVWLLSVYFRFVSFRFVTTTLLTLESRHFHKRHPSAPEAFSRPVAGGGGHPP